MSHASELIEVSMAEIQASLNLSLERMKIIEERSKSTDATLAHIARLQASWEPAKQAAQVATTTTLLSSTPTVASLNLSLKRGKQMEELSRSIDVSLAETARLREGMECRRDSLARQMEAMSQAVARLSGAKASTPHFAKTPTPTVVVSSDCIADAVAPHAPDVIPSVMPTKSPSPGLSPKIYDVDIPNTAAMMEGTDVVASALAAHLPLTDEVVAVGALQVEDNHAAATPTRCLTGGLGVDAGVQLSALSRKATPSAHVATVMLSRDLKHNVEPFPKEEFDGVVTHIGGISLFLEPDLCSGEEMFTKRPFKDIACNKELVDQMLTEVVGMYVFIQSDLETHREHDRMSPWMRRSFSHWTSGMGGAHCMIDKAPPWRRKISPWSRSGFCPGLCDRLMHLFALVCTQSAGYFVVDVAVHHAAVLNPYIGMLTDPTKSFVGTPDVRYISMLVMHWHSTALKSSVVQFIGGALVTTYRTEHEVYSRTITALPLTPRNDANLQVTEIFSLFRRNDSGSALRFPFWNDDYTGLLAHVDVMSLFLELGMDSADDKFSEQPFKDIAWEAELADSLLTHVSGLSLFRELILAATEPWLRSAFISGFQEQRYMVLLFSDSGQRSFQIISNCDNFASPLTLQNMKNHEEVCEQWDPGILVKVFRLVLCDVDTTKRLFLGNQFQISETTGRDERPAPFPSWKAYWYDELLVCQRSTSIHALGDAGKGTFVILQPLSWSWFICF